MIVDKWRKIGFSADGLSQIGLEDLSGDIMCWGAVVAEEKEYPLLCIGTHERYDLRHEN